MFKVLFLESRKIKTQNCAPIQCTVWPRNAVKAFRKLNKTPRACILHHFLRHSNPKIAFKGQNAENLYVQYKLYKSFRQKLLDVMKKFTRFKIYLFFYLILSLKINSSVKCSVSHLDNIVGLIYNEIDIWDERVCRLRSALKQKLTQTGLQEKCFTVSPVSSN